MNAENNHPAPVDEPQISLSSHSSSVHQAPKSNRRRRAEGHHHHKEGSSSKPNRAKRVTNEDDGNGPEDPLGRLKEFHPVLKGRLEALEGDLTRTQIKKRRVLGQKTKNYSEIEEERVSGDDTDEKEKHVFLTGALKILDASGMPGVADDGMTFIGMEDAEELNRRWKELVVEEVALFIRKLELMKETALKILDGMNKF